MMANNAIILYDTDHGEVCSTNLVFDDNDKAELQKYILSDTACGNAYIEQEPFDYVCDCKREPRDKRMANLGILNAS
jgi:hypothetical protein